MAARQRLAENVADATGCVRRLPIHPALSELRMS
jgi:hypothetical protein